MGYIFISLALAAGLTKTYFSKKISIYTNCLSSAVAVNTIRMFLCIIIGFTLICFSGETYTILPPTRQLIFTSLLSGIATASFVVSWLLAVRSGVYMMVEVFLMLGVLIPMLTGQFLFKEKIRPIQWIGFIILLLAAFIMCSYNKSQRGKLSLLSLLILLLCGISGGLSDLSQKLFMSYASDFPASVFNFYTYIFATVVLIPFWLFTRKKEKLESENKFPFKLFGFIILVAICLFGNSYFKTLSADKLDASKLYPLNQGAALILSSIMATVAFKEKLTFTGIIGIFLSFIGLICINFL